VKVSFVGAGNKITKEWLFPSKIGSIEPFRAKILLSRHKINGLKMKMENKKENQIFIRMI
jgi:hypothetical protein